VREGRLGTIAPARFVPVRIAAKEPVAGGTLPPGNQARGVDMIEIVLPDGSCVRVGNEVSLTALRRVMTALRG
jgi:transposase